MNSIQLLKFNCARPVLDVLRRYPERVFCIRELSLTAKTPFASTWRLVQIWCRAGLVTKGKLGKSVTVKFRKTPYSELVIRLSGLITSSQAQGLETLKKVIKQNPKIKQAFVFGSVARGHEKPDSDIDLALLTRKDFDAVKFSLKLMDDYAIKPTPLTFHKESELIDFLNNLKPSGSTKIK